MYIYVRVRVFACLREIIYRLNSRATRDVFSRYCREYHGYFFNAQKAFYIKM